MKKPKIKPIEKILGILRLLGQEHLEMPLAFHIALATEDTTLDTLSDKEFLEYLETYQGSLSVDETIEEDYSEEFYGTRMELTDYEEEIED